MHAMVTVPLRIYSYSHSTDCDGLACHVAEDLAQLYSYSHAALMIHDHQLKLNPSTITVCKTGSHQGYQFCKGYRIPFVFVYLTGIR